nr:hypothetical protein [Tanacetum cinerariifolium]
VKVQDSCWGFVIEGSGRSGKWVKWQESGDSGFTGDWREKLEGMNSGSNVGGQGRLSSELA